MSDSLALNVLEILVLAVGIVSVFTTNVKAEEILVIIWVILAVLYIFGSFYIGDHESVSGKFRSIHVTGDKARDLFYATNFVPVFASLFGLYASIAYQNIFSEQSASNKLIAFIDHYQIQTIVVCILGWIIMHVGYAHIYEQIDIESGYKSFRFPGTDAPTGTEYLYLGFTIGQSFATSDVDIKTSEARKTAARQSFISFAYNTVVIAIVVKLITGA